MKALEHYMKAFREKSKEEVIELKREKISIRKNY
jgi:transcriptional regulator CtsR